MGIVTNAIAVNIIAKAPALLSFQVHTAKLIVRTNTTKIVANPSKTPGVRLISNPLLLKNMRVLSAT